MIFGRAFYETIAQQRARLAAWHPFFPLFPRHVEGAGWVCFQWIESSGKYLGVRAGWLWTYRLPPTGYAFA